MYDVPDILNSNNITLTLFSSTTADIIGMTDDYFMAEKLSYYRLTRKRQILIKLSVDDNESNRKAMNRNWSNQKANPALKTKTGSK